VFEFFRHNPAFILILSFVLIIITGTLFLKIPGAYSLELSWIDALFTATSATCVTGLIVKDTPNDFSLFGQIIILILIQLGGMGLMTFSMSFAAILGKKLNFSSKAMINKMLDYDRPGYTAFILKKVLTMMIIIELVGFLLYVIAFNINGVKEGLIFTSLFHSISAFCNAGFSTFSDSLIGFRSSFLINFITSTLIVLGGLGFFVMIEYYSYFKKKLENKNFVKKLTVQARMVGYVTVFMIITGALMFFILEKNNILYGESFSTRIYTSFFQSITTRTAGFNTVNTGGLTRATLLVFVLFMFIGAAPGGTAGGIKITTVYIFLKNFLSMIRNSQEVYAFGRKIPKEIVNKATGIFFVSIFLNFVAIILLSITEPFELTEIIFETVSAFGTVGLSTGITPYLSNAGKLIIIILMFAGRLGPLTLAVAVGNTLKKEHYSLPEEKVMIG
jgi:trk system potassium uptake protein TrkH